MANIEPVKEPKRWEDCLVGAFPVSDEGELKISLADPIETLLTIDLLGQALMDYFDHQIPDDNVRIRVKQLRDVAGDAHWYMIDQGDHG